MRENPRSRTRRRRFGSVCIGMAILLLLAGETVLRAALANNIVLFAAYWMACFILTALAAGAAIIDAARVRLESREEQRSLLEKTLLEVEREKQGGKRPKH